MGRSPLKTALIGLIKDLTVPSDLFMDPPTFLKYAQGDGGG